MDWLAILIWLLGMPLMASDMRYRGAPGNILGRFLVVAFWPVLMALAVVLWVFLSLVGES